MYLKNNTFLRLRALLLALICATPATAAKREAAPFTEAQQAQIGPVAQAYFTAHPDELGEAVATYLADHPEFLVAASENLRQRQQVARQQAQVQIALRQQAQLLSGDNPAVGPKTAGVAVVMFFDYQSSSCNEMAPVVAQLVKANPDVRFIFIRLPISAARWPVSEYAANVGAQIWQRKGGEAWFAYHNAVYATGKNEGKLQASDVRQAAKTWLSPAQLTALTQTPAVTGEALAANQALAQQMGFRGTLAFVVMPQSVPANAQRVYVASGGTTQEVLQMAIQKAKGEGRNTRE